MTMTTVAAMIAAAFTLTACGTSHQGLLDDFQDIPAVNARNIGETVDSACGVYESMTPQQIEESGLPTADEMIASAIAGSGDVTPADARYMARMIGIDACPDVAMRHLYEDGEGWEEPADE